MELRWKGVSLPYRIVSKDQRVSHTAIVENKRLSHALTIVMAQQDLKRETKVLTNSEKTDYKKRSRQVYGPNFIEKPLAPKAVHDDEEEGKEARLILLLGRSRDKTTWQQHCRCQTTLKNPTPGRSLPPLRCLRLFSPALLIGIPIVFPRLMIYLNWS